MSALLDMARPPTLFDVGVIDAPAVDRPTADAPVADVPVAAAPTLAWVIETAWAELTAGRAVACPVCAATMEPVYGASALSLGGRCGGCRSRLG